MITVDTGTDSADGKVILCNFKPDWWRDLLMTDYLEAIKHEPIFL
jgi:hypothetical protein